MAPRSRKNGSSTCPAQTLLLPLLKASTPWFTSDWKSGMDAGPTLFGTTGALSTSMRVDDTLPDAVYSIRLTSIVW